VCVKNTPHVNVTNCGNLHIECLKKKKGQISRKAKQAEEKSIDETNAHLHPSQTIQQTMKDIMNVHSMPYTNKQMERKTDKVTH
jgi:hypothetical protein